MPLPLSYQVNKLSSNERGCPQGSILLPILANVYLHYVIDLASQENVFRRSISWDLQVTWGKHEKGTGG